MKQYRFLFYKLIGFLFMAFLIFSFSLKVGSVPLAWTQLSSWIYALLTNPLSYSPDTDGSILFFIRLPRVLMAAAVGGLLASAGCTLQAVFRNPLADPYLLGISGGAALGAVTGLALGLFSPFPLACLGAVVSLLIVLFLARIQSTVNVSLIILAGVAVHSFSSSLLTLILSQVSDRYETSGIFFWLLGSLDTLPYKTLIPFLMGTVASLGVLYLFAPVLNLMAQGEEAAQALGLPIEKMKWILVLICALLTGLAVTFNGMIPFVGLIVPHFVRLLFGNDHRITLPLSGFLGALLVMVSDALGRFLLAPHEIPAGVITAMVGAPFFLFILRRERKKLL